jgi:uroporphyrinogen-III synthase
MARLDGVTVALLETRKAADVALLIERLGGTPRSVPSVFEIRRDSDVAPAIEGLVADRFDVVVVLTAAAFEALLTAADEQGRSDAVVAALGRAVLACRGPKPLLSLRTRGLMAAVTTAKPHTTDELLAALSSLPLAGRRVLLLHYGERNAACAEALTSRGARLTEAALYEWTLPLDMAPLNELVRDLVARQIDAVLFTSQVQFRHLLEAARRTDREEALIAALRDDVIVGSVGPVCSRAIRAAGIVPDVMPSLPNGPSLVNALADYLSMFTPPEDI